MEDELEKLKVRVSEFIGVEPEYVFRTYDELLNWYIDMLADVVGEDILPMLLPYLDVDQMIQDDERIGVVELDDGEEVWFVV